MKPLDRAKLVKRRKAEGYTQRQLAGACGCSQAAVSDLESGTMPRCSEDLAQHIAKWLRRDVDELFLREEHSRPHRVTDAAGSTRQKEAAAA